MTPRIMLLAVGATALWGLCVSLIGVAIATMSATDLLVVRLGIAGLCFAGLLAIGWIRWQAIPVASLPRFLSATLLGVVVFNIVANMAVARVPAGLVVVAVQAAPMIVMAIEWALGRIRRSDRPLLSLGVWIVGMAVVIMHYGVRTDGALTPTTVLLLIATPLAWSVSMILSRPLIRDHGAANVCAQMWICGGVVVCCVYASRSAFWLAMASAGSTAILAAIGLAILGTVVAYTLWSIGLARASSAALAPYLNLVPAFGLLFAWLLLGEPITIWLLLGAGLMIAGCVAMPTAPGGVKEGKAKPPVASVHD